MLRPGGVCIFTVPLTGQPATVERAFLKDGSPCHLLPPEYHGDRLSGPSSVLVYRDYGHDIRERLQLAGFERALLWRPESTYLGHLRDVVVTVRA